ncbi:MAG: heavy metal-binding domain-containing protein [Bacteroidales bacterium]|nr:heavy metal-binding domain-containing protein [Clostridium sp.]MCM1203984.1 heavy metal-binding domain-containing protein [Bacteroidales bacterium]
MGEIMLTTGSGFEGYDVVEYLGFVNGQIALSSNFFKDLSSNLAELSTQESTAFTNKLENASENAILNLTQVARTKGANAVIGVELNYTGFSNNAVGTVASGTAVIIRKKEAIHKVVTSRIYVSNYYNMLMPRPVEVTLAGEDNVVKIAPLFYNYNQDEIKAVRCDIELTNYYEEKLLLQGIDFVFEKNNITKLQADFVECKLPMKDIPLIKDVKVYVKKYVTAKGVFAPDTDPIDIEMSKRSLDGLKDKRGKDAVERYKSDGTTWICNCGYINAAGDEECAICGRKEEDLKVNVGFNYEEMCNRMKGLPNVSAMKDILMEYIKRGAIDAKYRMELLEIMESGLQYEKTRGDMTDTVLEKVLKVFEN